MVASRLFPGLLPFDSDDADIFFGRDKESVALLSHIEQDPVVVVTGLSGCGKSSLIKAGILPRLQASEKLVVYTSVFENIIEDVLHEIARMLRTGQSAEDYVDALQQLHRQGPGFGGAYVGLDNLGSIRSLIRAAFTDKELRRFCQDRSAFQPILTRVASDSGLEDMVDALIEHCQTQALLPQLLTEIRQVNPRQYGRYITPLDNQSAIHSKPQPQFGSPPEPRQPIVLIVDQFERALRPPHPTEALKTFVKGISRLVGQPRRFATVVILLRADWLYFLETSVRRFYPSLNVYSVVFTLDPLSSEAAREAIVGPLQAKGIDYDDGVVRRVVDCLQRSSIGPALGSFVQPIQLQMVVRALFDLAESSGNPQQAFTEGNYEQSGGVERILRDYLVSSVGNRSEAWRLLARFIAQDGQTGRTIRRSELLSVPAAGDIQAELGFLVNQGFLAVYEAEGVEDTYYRLAHDYLVEAIIDYLNKNPDQQGWKLAEEWLARGTLEWRESALHGEADDLLLEENRYSHIYQYRDKLRLTDEAQRLLVLTTLRHGHEGLGYWLSRGPNPEEDLEVVVDRLLAAETQVQQAARDALANSLNPVADATATLEAQEQQALGSKLRRVLISPANPNEQVAAARALWILGAFDTTQEQIKIGTIVLRRWAQDHSLRIASYALTAVFVLALIAGILFVRDRLRGSWQLSNSLKAGNTPLVVVDPRDSDALYVVTQGGPGPREGNSLFVQQGSDWELRSREFSHVAPTSMIVVSNNGGTSLYATMYGAGVMRSQDDGRTWELANRGLPSHGLVSIVADPDHPNMLYVATSDWRGVLKSSDSGDSWDYYDYQGEIYGAMILRLAYTRANGGTLLAGTDDGRILAHRRGAMDWELRHGLSKGAIMTLVVAEADDNYIYAGTTRGIIIRSQDGGERWEVMGQPSDENNAQFNIVAMDVAPDDPQRLYVSTYGNGGYTVWESLDMGQNWNMLPGIGLPRTWTGSLVVTGQVPYRLVVGSQDGLFASSDGGINWKKEALNAPLARIRGIRMSENYPAPVYAAVGGSIYTNLEGDLQDWVHGKGLQAETVRSLIADPDNPQVAFAGVLLLGEWSVFSTRDGGRTWQQTSAPSIEPIVPDTAALALAKTQDGDSILYAGTIGCGVFRSMDEGRTWNTLGRERCDQTTGSGMPADVYLLAIDAKDPDWVYAGAGQEIFRSTDGGSTWQRLQTGVDSVMQGMVADPVRAKALYLVAGPGGFWRTEDGGNTWHQESERWFSGTELTAICATPGETGHLIVGASNGGVWTTSNGGRTWRSIREELAISSISSIATSAALEGKILVGSYDDGIALFTPGQLFGNSR
jgi:photosystem II stability/assembly factor-like uncharacterized protein